MFSAGACLSALLAAGSLLGFTAASEAAPLRIMPMGDSITEGFGTSNDAGYRGPLQQLLIDNGVDYDFVGTQSDGTYSLTSGTYDDAHEGYGGFQADKLKSQGGDSDPSSSLKYKLDNGNVFNNITAAPDAILLHVGTNTMNKFGTQYGDPDDTGTTAYNSAQNQLERLLTHLRDEPTLSDTQILMAKIIPNVEDVDNTGFQEGRYTNTEEYNAILGDVIQHFASQSDQASKDFADRISLVDMFNAADWAEDTDGNGIPDSPNSTYMTDDGLHPTAAGYDIMAQKWYDAMLATDGVPVPEPGTLALSVMGGLIMLAPWRRRAT